MEAIIVLVGFLCTGKTTLLKSFVKSSLESHFKPLVTLNDYENAEIDAQQFLDFL